MTGLGKELAEAACRALSIVQEGTDPSTDSLTTLAGIDVRGIRRATGLTQIAFARRFRFHIDTLRDLERGRIRPDGPTRAYLMIIGRDHAAVKRLLDTPRG